VLSGLLKTFFKKRKYLPIVLKMFISELKIIIFIDNYMKKLLFSIILIIIISMSVTSCNILKKDCDCPPTPAIIPLKII